MRAKYFSKAEFVHIKIGIFAFSKQSERLACGVVLVLVVRVLFPECGFWLAGNGNFVFFISHPVPLGSKGTKFVVKEIIKR